MILDFKHIKDWGKFSRWRGALHVAVDKQSQIREAIATAYRQNLHLVVFYVVDLELRPYARQVVREYEARLATSHQIGANP